MHASSIAAPKPLEKYEIDSELDEVNDFELKAGLSFQEKEDYEYSTSQELHFISQVDLDNLIHDLNLSKQRHSCLDLVFSSGMFTKRSKHFYVSQK